MADNPLNAVNRGVYISDNLPFLRRLNDGCIDLVCIDPPFAKNETFGHKNAKAPDPLKPPLSDAEKEKIAKLQPFLRGQESRGSEQQQAALDSGGSTPTPTLSREREFFNRLNMEHPRHGGLNMETVGIILILLTIPIAVWMLRSRKGEKEAKLAGEFWPDHKRGNRKIIGGLIGLAASIAILMLTGTIGLLPAGFFALSIPAGYIQLNKADEMERKAQGREEC